MKLFIACEDSDRLTGFYYSHNGFWNVARTSKGSKTRIECKNTCTEDCVAFHTYANNWYYTSADHTGNCYHYSDRSDLISATEVISSMAKAYIKCSGRDSRDYCFKLVVLEYHIHSWLNFIK